MNKLKIHFLSYRDWAEPILQSVKRHPRVGYVDQSKTINDYLSNGVKHYDIVMLCGWSNWDFESKLYSFDIKTIINDNLNKTLHVGLHCAESDLFHTTPLQNQIINGVKDSKHRVFKVGIPELIHREYSHEVDLSLRGNIEDVFKQLTYTGIVLYDKFLDDYPNIVWKTWPEENNRFQSRTPADSEMKNFKDMTCEQMYDFIRCLGDPYPNAFVSDETGELYFEKVRFKKK
jgi:hypothetical protein